MAHVLYVNKQTRRMAIHEASCPAHTNHNDVKDSDGVWHGPYEIRDLAQARAEHEHRTMGGGVNISYPHCPCEAN